MIRSEIANSTEYRPYGFSWILVKKKISSSLKKNTYRKMVEFHQTT